MAHYRSRSRGLEYGTGGGVRRLVGFQKVVLDAGKSQDVDIVIDPRLIAKFDTAKMRWVSQSGAVEIEVGHDSAAFDLHSSITVPAVVSR
ncbi:fibronectin type III-like domain-contianing protein [Sphingobium sp. B2]|uniref:fibronectin type III-like domain-contianing protein n=1 Tax=Sphingobium sp. B2 TaxID=2583228 RepID=UPI0011A9F5D0